MLNSNLNQTKAEYQYKVIFAIKCFNDYHLQQSLKLTCQFQINSEICQTNLPFSEGLFLDLNKLTQGDLVKISFHNDASKALLGSISINIPHKNTDQEEVEISEDFSVPFDIQLSDIKLEYQNLYIEKKQENMYHLEGSFYIIILNRYAYLKQLESKASLDPSNATTPQFISPKNQINKKRMKTEVVQQKSKSNSKIKTVDNQQNQSLDYGKPPQRVNKSINPKEKTNNIAVSRQKTMTQHSEQTNQSPTGSSSYRQVSSPSKRNKNLNSSSTSTNIKQDKERSVSQVPQVNKSLLRIRTPPENEKLEAQDMSYVKYFEDSEAKRTFLQREIMKCMEDLVNQKDTYIQIINDRQDQLDVQENDKKAYQNQIKILQQERDTLKFTLLETRMELDKLKTIQNDYKVLHDQQKCFLEEHDKKERLINEQQKRLEQQLKDIQQVFEELQSYVYILQETKKYESRKDKNENLKELASLRNQMDENQWKLVQRDQEIDELKQRGRISSVLESNLELSSEMNQIQQNEAKDNRKQIQLFQSLVEQYKEQLQVVSQKKYEIEWSLNNEVSVRSQEVEQLKDKLMEQDQDMRQFELINQELKCEVKFLQGKLLIQEDLQAQLNLRNQQNYHLVHDNKELKQNVSSLNTVLISISENQLHQHNNGQKVE